MKNYTLMLALMLIIVGTILAGCKRSSECSSCASLRQHVKLLETENAGLRNENYQEMKKKGYFVIATWVAVVSASCLFAVGLAMGVKIQSRRTQARS